MRRAALAARAGGVETLVQLIDSSHPDLQYEAAEALVDVCCGQGGKELAQRAIAAGAVEALVRLLSREQQQQQQDADVLQASVGALANICSNVPDIMQRAEGAAADAAAVLEAEGLAAARPEAAHSAVRRG